MTTSRRSCAEDADTDTPGRPEIQVFPTSDALTAGAAECFVAVAAAAIRTTGRFILALSGGVTPRALYERLASQGYSSRVNWPQAQVFWGDERCVPADDAASNARMAREALLDNVPVRSERVHAIRGQDDPVRAATAYESELRAALGTPAGAPTHAPGACFDLVLLGLGGDGHTASLFPGMSAVRETELWVMAEYIPAVSAWRVTLTPIVVNAASEIVFLVSGREKASILQRVLEGPPDAQHLPAQTIAPTAGRLRWLVDADAAANLDRGGR
ncbi:MAG TPA: 6-phosphogluconolactonase [Gemmatimonadaceae bacterium]|nr:6-phosphogluconolactonase [Gemmatimonadaceae bacterium]